MKKIIRCCWVGLMTLGLWLPLSASAYEFNELVVFGDSLSDNGNLYRRTLHQVPKTPYYLGRFSDGLVWPEILAELLDINLNNYAYGGAKTAGRLGIPSLNQQLDSYFRKHKTATPQSVYIIWIGANDYFEVIEKGDDVSAIDSDFVVANIAKAVNQLVERGAVKVVVVNLPNLGNTPWARAAATEYGADLPALATAVSQTHNEKLQGLLQNVEKNRAMKNQAVDVMLFDSFAILEDVIIDATLNPSSSKYFDLQPGHRANVLEQCFSGDYLGTPGTQCDFPQDYLFWDHLHPTTAMHYTLAKVVLADLMDKQWQAKASARASDAPIAWEAIEQFNRLTTFAKGTTQANH